MKKKHKAVECFACKGQFSQRQIARRGTRRFGGRLSYWFLCRECHTAFLNEREMDKQAYRAAQGDMRVGERDSESMGWNGVPSERSLKARKR